MTEVIAVTIQVARILEKLGIPYALGGSLASMAYGEVRTTHDVDFIIDPREDSVRALAAALAPDFYIEESAVRDAFRRQGSFNAIHLRTMIKADFFVAGRNPLDPMQLRGARDLQVDKDADAIVKVTSPEDIILRKLDWFRLGREVSERQWRDILGVLKVAGSHLNLEYLQSSAASVSLEALLRRALRESGLTA